MFRNKHVHASLNGVDAIIAFACQMTFDVLFKVTIISLTLATRQSTGALANQSQVLVSHQWVAKSAKIRIHQ